MSESPRYSSDLHRKFAEASQLGSEETVREYLDRECGEDHQQRQLLQRMLQAHADGKESELLRAAEGLKTIPEAVAEADERKEQLKHTSTEWPQIARYDLLDVLGEGAMGTVYRARQTEPLNREVAVKVIKPGMDSRQVLVRFEREKQMLTRLDHAHICKVFDAGMTLNGYPYFSMELVRGPTLYDYCCQRQLSLHQRLQLIIDVCQAVQHAHQRQIVHRDLKPSNVLVTEIDGHPTVKVIDFGVAKALENNSPDGTHFTYFQQLIGTPRYMSPEQLGDDRQGVDARSDIYSIGCLLYKLLTGFTPFETDAARAELGTLRQRILASRPQAPSRLLRDERLRSPERLAARIGLPQESLGGWMRAVHGPLDRLVLKLLEKDPGERYQSLLELGADLQRIVDGQPIRLKGTPLYVRAAQTARRHRVGLLVASCLVAMLIGGVMLADRLRRDAEVADRLLLEQQRVGFDNLEVARLQSLVSAFQQRDLSSMRQIDLPRESDGGFLRPIGVTAEAEVPHGSLRKLLTRVANPQPYRVLEHPDYVDDFSISSDRRWIATGCGDGWLRVWDFETGELQFRLGPYSWAVTAVAFSPDDSILASADRDGFVVLWDLERSTDGSLLKPAKAYYRGEERETGVESLNWSPDGSMLAVCYRYRPVEILRVDGTLVHRFEAVENSSSNPEIEYPRNYNVLFTSDGTRAYLRGPSPHPLQLWSINNSGGNPRFEQLATAGFSVQHAPLSWDGPQMAAILAGQYTGSSLSVIDSHDLNEVHEIPTSSSQPRSINVNKDGTMIASGYGFGKISLARIHRSERGIPNEFHDVIDFTGLPHDSVRHSNEEDRWEIANAELLAEDKLVSSSMDGTVCYWDLRDVLPVQELSGIRGTTFFPSSTDGEIFVARRAVDKNTLRKVKLSTSEEVLWEAPLANDGVARVYGGGISNGMNPLGNIGVSSTRKFIVTRTSHAIEIRRSRDGRLVGKIAASNEEPTMLAVSPDGRRVAEASKFDVRVWESRDGWQRFQRIGEYTDPYARKAFIMGIEFCSDGDTLAISTDERFVTVDPHGCKVIHEIPQRRAESFALSADERLLCLIDREHGIRVFNRRTSEMIFNRNLSDAIRCQFADHGRTLIVLHSNNVLRAWHLPTGTKIGDLYDGTGGETIRGFFLGTDSRLHIIVGDPEYSNEKRLLVVGS